MKMILRSTTTRVAAVLAHFRGMRANRPRPEGLGYGRRQRVQLPADPSRIPAYLRPQSILISATAAHRCCRWQWF